MIDIDIKDKYIGTIIGQYLILSKCDERSKNNLPLYNGKCIKCGYIRKRTILQEFKNKNVKCKHTIEDQRIWYNIRLCRIFNSMKSRCYNTNNDDYRFYGKKGIKVCDEWLNNSQSFNDWAINNGYTDDLTIDRIDSSKDYEPNNCRWISLKENAKFKSTTNYIEVDGIVDSGRAWSKKLGLGINHINKYLRKNGYNKCVKYIKLLLNTKN